MSDDSQNTQSVVEGQRQPFLVRVLARLYRSKSPNAAVQRMSPDPLDSARRTELVAEFMLAEFNALQERARDVDQMNASRINFYLLIVAAVGAGLGAAEGWLSKLPQPSWVLVPALGALLLLGLVTFYYSTYSAIHIIWHYRMAGRIRCWFADLDNEAVGYFPYVPADNRPKFTTRFFMFRGGEAIVVATNALLAAASIAMMLYQIQALRYPWLLATAAVVVWPVAWFLQRRFFIRRMEHEQEGWDPRNIHFVDIDREALYRRKRDERIAQQSLEH